MKAKQHVLEKLEARVAGSSDAELSRLLGENEATAKRRAAITARLQVRQALHHDNVSDAAKSLPLYAGPLMIYVELSMSQKYGAL